MSAEAIPYYQPEETEPQRPLLSLVPNRDPNLDMMYLFLADAAGSVISYAVKDVDSDGRPRFYTAEAWASRQNNR